jgi:hypothetical protein
MTTVALDGVPFNAEQFKLQQESQCMLRLCFLGGRSYEMPQYIQDKTYATIAWRRFLRHERRRTHNDAFFNGRRARLIVSLCYRHQQLQSFGLFLTFVCNLREAKRPANLRYHPMNVTSRIQRYFTDYLIGQPSQLAPG